MKENIFSLQEPDVLGNPLLRIPQKEGYQSVLDHFQEDGENTEIGIILPVGCGKSGLITLVPFALRSRRVLVVAPRVNIAQQLYRDFDPSNPSMFYTKCRVLSRSPYPEPVEIRGTTTNRSDLDEADVVVTNIQQLQGESNRWLQSLPSDFFDLILFDEAHHNVAESWNLLRSSFPNAKIINFSATPRRSDGQIMAGQIIYSFPIFRAIEEGYVKRIKGLVLNPTSLRYVRADNEEMEVGLEEVRRLGETDADFRRSVVTSEETLLTIVDASIRELHRIRRETGDNKHKIIAAALNYSHCIQVVEAYRSRGLIADYIHSREDSPTNQRVLTKLANHELDVIVQVRKLGEGFDHPYLSVATVFSIFNSLSPFVQFVGRIMRVIEQNAPTSLQNQGTVVFHAGANIARLWEDFQEFSQADQDFFDQLLPLEDLNFGDSDELIIEPSDRNSRTPRQNQVSIIGQEQVIVQEIPLLNENEEARRAFELLRQLGLTPEQYQRAYEHESVPTTKVRERQAARMSLEENIRNETGRILAEHNLNPQGYDLDTRRLGRTNYVVIKTAIDKKVNSFVNRRGGERSEFSRQELESIRENFDNLVEQVIAEVLE